MHPGRCGPSRIPFLGHGPLLINHQDRLLQTSIPSVPYSVPLSSLLRIHVATLEIETSAIPAPESRASPNNLERLERHVSLHSWILENELLDTCWKLSPRQAFGHTILRRPCYF